MNDWRKIDNVDNTVEAAILQDILRLEGIESMLFYKDGTGYIKILTGNIIGTQGVDICVEEKDFERAKEIISIYREEFEEVHEE